MGNKDHPQLWATAEGPEHPQNIVMNIIVK